MGELECLVPSKGSVIVTITRNRMERGNEWDMVMPGYKLYRNDSEEQTRNGVAVCVKESIESIN